MKISTATAKRLGLLKKPKARTKLPPKLNGPHAIKMIWLKDLPMPPSTNHYLKHGKGRMYISKEAKSFRSIVKAKAFDQGHVIGRIRLTLYMGDALDIDNGLKCLLDAMQWVGLFLNDNQIDRLLVVRDAEQEGVTVFLEGELPKGDE